MSHSIWRVKKNVLKLAQCLSRNTCCWQSNIDTLIIDCLSFSKNRSCRKDADCDRVHAHAPVIRLEHDPAH